MFIESLYPFKTNQTLTLGIELELQLVDLHNFNLTMEAKDFLRRLSEVLHPGELKPEITQSMIEFNSSIHSTYPSLLDEVTSFKNILIHEAHRAHIGICGGGTHPFQKWAEQRIFPEQRFINLSDQYGYLAKQFTIFGQHIHIGVNNGDDALYLCHALARYIPQFIALSASSPFHHGIDTTFDCSRINMINAFPLSGTPPWVLKWSEFENFYHKMLKLNVVTSMKDFYWDIRPKPEFGTVELRICDTPLTIEKAVDLAAYAQALVAWLLETRVELFPDMYLTYMANRFRASRYGLDAVLVDPLEQKEFSISEDIAHTCDLIAHKATQFESEEALHHIKEVAQTKMNDAQWLRQKYSHMNSLNDIVREQIDRWHGEIHTQ